MLSIKFNPDREVVITPCGVCECGSGASGWNPDLVQVVLQNRRVLRFETDDESKSLSECESNLDLEIWISDHVVDRGR